MEHDLVQLRPFDKYNRNLESNVHPVNWEPPAARNPYHLVVIGGGTAGLVTAAGAATLGARVALIESELMGGDCLNVGCVPSKALIRSARVAATVRDSETHGIILSAEPQINFAMVMERMRRLRSTISPNDAAKRFAELGVDVFFGQGSFVDKDTVRITQQDNSSNTLKFKKAVLATGARAVAPPIPGIENVTFLTNENLFSITELPRRFGIIGSGPIGSEMAQTFSRLGSQVTLFEQSDRILTREDPQAAEIIQEQLGRDGVDLRLNSQDMRLSQNRDGAIVVQVVQQDTPCRFEVDQLLVAVGRAPNTEGLNLETVNVKYDRHGVQVNEYLETTNPRIYAAGDISSQYKFTHAADFQARIVIQNALFAIGRLGRKSSRDLIIPWTTYTSPEIAHVGLYEHDAKRNGILIDTYIQQLSDTDRAVLDEQDAGFVKVHTKRGTDQIIGATIVAENAGDMISEIGIAMTNRIGLSKIASTIHPYPTQAEAIRKLGDQFNRTKLTPFGKRVLNLLRQLNVGR